MGTIGSRIRHRRKELQLSAVRLAAKLGIAQETLSRYERDHVTPQVERLVEIAEALGVGTHWLATGVEQPASIEPAPPAPTPGAAA